MISTVTVNTITTAMSITSIAVLGLVPVSPLLLCYCSSACSPPGNWWGASDGSRQRLIGRCLNISIIPLVISFAVIVALKVFEILG